MCLVHVLFAIIAIYMCMLHSVWVLSFDHLYFCSETKTIFNVSLVIHTEFFLSFCSSLKFKVLIHSSQFMPGFLFYLEFSLEVNSYHIQELGVERNGESANENVVWPCLLMTRLTALSSVCSSCNCTASVRATSSCTVLDVVNADSVLDLLNMTSMFIVVNPEQGFHWPACYRFVSHLSWLWLLWWKQLSFPVVMVPIH